MIRVCFVCLGNICRSPTAECVMRHLVTAEGLADQIAVDSAGTSNYHPGAAPDPRTRAAGKRRGVEIRGNARQVKHEDFLKCDYLVAMDRDNFEALSLQVPANSKAKVVMLRAFEASNVNPLECGAAAASVPDPYHGNDADFDEVFEQCLQACRGLLTHLVQQLKD